MSLSIIIPSFNEENSILETLKSINDKFDALFEYEVVIVDDFSTDNTLKIFENCKEKNYQIVKNVKKGVGHAIKTGIENSNMEYVCIFMADSSDSLDDLEKYYYLIKEFDLDAVLGSRFLKESRVDGYPLFKLFLNRLFNLLVQLLFLSNYNDFTNAFKIYKKKTLMKLFPLVSNNFNIFLEIPLKIIYKNFSYKIIAINWRSRKTGYSKFKIKELSSKYFFTLLYCYLDKILISENK